MDVTETLRVFLETGEDWERKGTSLKGVSIIRLPKTKNRPASLAVEVNPLDENGRPMKKKGIMLMGSDEIAAFKDVFTNNKLENLVSAMESVLPERRIQKKQQDDLLEI
jgi:hypothetical protein